MHVQWIDGQQVTELVADYGFFFVWFKTNYDDVQALERAIAVGHDAEVRRECESKREFYERRLTRMADRFAETVGALRAAAERLGVTTGGLDALARVLAYRPFHPYPKTFPPEDILAAADADCSKVAGASALLAATADPNHPEPQPLRGRRTLELLEAMLELGATAEVHRKPADDIVQRAFGFAAECNNHKVPLRDLVRGGYAASMQGSGGGYWLTPLGLKTAQGIAGDGG